MVMNKNIIWIIGAIILISFLFFNIPTGMKEAGPLGEVVTRGITPSIVAPGDVVTIRYTVTGSSGPYAGILTEVIPTGYAVDSTSFINNMDGFAKRITGQTIEVPFAGSADNQFIQYSVIAGSTTASLASGVIDWSDNNTDVIVSADIVVSGNQTCTDTTWTPDISTLCTTQIVTQTSNCGNTRTIVGTKDCFTNQTNQTCDCSVWTDVSCSGEQMIQERVCVPDGCDIQSQLVDSEICEPTTTGTTTGTTTTGTTGGTTPPTTPPEGDNTLIIFALVGLILFQLNRQRKSKKK